MIALLLPLNSIADLIIPTPTLKSNTPTRSWKSLRDDGVVKQKYDYSCGAASLATILSFYGANFTEKQIMDAMGKNNNVASFDDMAKPKFDSVTKTNLLKRFEFF